MYSVVTLAMSRVSTTSCDNDMRVHYRNETYELRRNLNLLDWNEHVSRDVCVEHVDGGYEKLQTKDLCVLLIKFGWLYRMH
jgi:hypothetical protein